jgi:DNA-directed RNA polymerase specialized sigma subunit
MQKIPNQLTACLDQYLRCVNWGKLVQLSNEDLCKNAQQGCRASSDLLWHRLIDFIQLIVYRENKRQHLPQNEIADALQELYFAFHTTVQRYDPANHCDRKPASFKTFLGIVVAHEFAKYCTLWRIYHKRVAVHLDGLRSQCPNLSADESLEFSDGGKNGNDSLTLNREGILFSEISSDRLADTLCHLKLKEKKLLEIWLQYDRDKEVAQVLGISPAAAKLRRERLFSRIKQRVTVK